MSEPTEELKGNEPKREKVRIIPIELIDDFPNHPFLVKDDESMEQLIKSIEMNGVLNPVIARKKEGERYELISGHRRKHACEKLGVKQIPIIVYCYHCKARLTTSRYKESYIRADGTTYYAEHGRYVCHHRSRRLNECDGATTYNADKIDEAVIEIMRQMFSSISGCPQEEKIEAAYKKAVATNHNLQTKLKADIDKNKRQLDNLRAEIVKALSGESMFTSDDLSNALQELSS